MDNIAQKLVIFFCFALLTNVHYCQAFEYNCFKEGFFAIYQENCTSFWYCVSNTAGQFYAMRYECPDDQVFSNKEQKCVPSMDNQCDAASDNNFGEDVNSSDQFKCPSQGRFPDKEAMDCRSYYFCEPISGNEFVATLTICPPSTIFSWTENKCVVASSYICPNTVTTTESTITTPVTQTTGPVDFVCSNIGSYPNPISSDCKDYYICTTTPDGTLEATLTKCTAGTIYSPNDGRCLSTDRYQCPGMTTTSTTPTTTTTTTISTTPTTTTSTEDPDQFFCTSTGRFPNSESEDCKTYYICTERIDGTKVATLARCPTNKLFSWASKICVPAASYICPVEIPPTQSPPLTTPSVEKFVCTTTGAFPNYDKLDCGSYKYCLRTADGKFLEYIFHCIEGWHFNPGQSQCTKNYSCPYITTPAA
ncbi:mucin-2-like [Toxorhynchites rutilus septentrionalis]|uniref:mucin-2-like n=1 Tax=Toxorhynchites rutilus septentrionalis TaxID=329112 RepID=UPI00247AAD73|nr:mucin-2-like [Toxorhynchites rutilus septentrionalis]